VAAGIAVVPMFLRLRLALVAVVLLSGCATPTPYQPATDGFGYADQQIETNRFRISFAGNSVTPRQTVENALLLRAAEMTLANQGDYFLVVERNTDANTVYYASFDRFPGFGGFYYGWGRGMIFPPRALSTGSIRPVTRFYAEATILVRSGEKPTDDPQAFDARDVIARVGPLVPRHASEQP
jgi:hypothetical protein